MATKPAPLRPLPISKKLQDCIQFARFCTNHKLQPVDLAQLLSRARVAFVAGEREANTGKPADTARAKFEQAAAALGFGVQWPGLWPTLTKGKGAKARQIDLPSINA